MKKRNVLILVILLAVGFAAVSTTLIINGTLNIAANENDFHVYFSNAIENGVENKNLIKDDTHIAFSQNMSLIGEKYILDYDVTNGSRNYDADLKMNCTESNEYLKVTNEFDEETNLSATETRTGKLTVEVLKAYVGIGYYRDSKQNITSVVSLHQNKTSMRKECKANGFVAQLVISQEKWLAIKNMQQDYILEKIDGLMPNKSACWDISDYLYQCNDIIDERIKNAWNTL